MSKPRLVLNFEPGGTPTEQATEKRKNSDPARELWRSRSGDQVFEYSHALRLEGQSERCWSWLQTVWPSIFSLLPQIRCGVDVNGLHGVLGSSAIAPMAHRRGTRRRLPQFWLITENERPKRTNVVPIRIVKRPGWAKLGKISPPKSVTPEW
ncbi:unnamed protein product [Protopolystoma xenopodis]|uniref:Uncharacterized protein n=1 Tax=Protopolystoma xenopodis TaxID=117903 RepID=A0A448XH46_9PLAT|nr:unnamed protein product [Protopolystoma xenopodis]